MRLADHFCAGAGSLLDIGGFAKNMKPLIEEAQIFEVSDEVAIAAHELLNSKPSSLVAALPLLRMPYEHVWIEYRGGLTDMGPRKADGAPVPWKQGALVTSMPGGQRGFMTFCWRHDTAEELNAINISPISIYFDWRPEGDAADMVEGAHQAIMEKQRTREARILLGGFIEAFEEKYGGARPTQETIRATFGTKGGWAKLINNPVEVEAYVELDRHMRAGISPHGTGLINTILANAETYKQLHRFINGWILDTRGEGGWVQCFLAMLNSRNPVVEHETINLFKLNKARVRAGKPKFLEYRKTRLALSRSQARIAAARGITREAARQHLVRGHFKIRKSGVYWWSPFLRGDPTRGPVKRHEYEVAP